METKNVMIVGVGGQGSLLASKLLGKLLTQEGFDVKVSEVHGMSQRGGSVVTYVRFGDKVYSPVISKGEADFIVSFEKIEAARYADTLKKDGKIIVQTGEKGGFAITGIETSHFDLGYVKLAHGRDAADCPVSRGQYNGFSNQETKINVILKAI